MNATNLTIAGLVTTLAVLGALRLIGSPAQESYPNPPLMTTNWTGCLVVGKADPMDKISGELYPTTDLKVEIGLRGDGVVVWRDATKTRLVESGRGDRTAPAAPPSPPDMSASTWRFQ